MDTPDTLVLQASYTNPVHAQAIGHLLNHYAQDPMGGGHSLPLDDPRLIQFKGSVQQLAVLGLQPAA